MKLVASARKTCEHVTIGFLWDAMQIGPENSRCQMLQWIIFVFSNTFRALIYLQ